MVVTTDLQGSGRRCACDDDPHSFNTRTPFEFLGEGRGNRKAAFGFRLVPALLTNTFKPDRTGTFRIVCLVPGHEPEGMWIVLTVVRSGSPAA